jgi:hypothetical protein
MDDVEALSTIVSVLKQLDPKAQTRVLDSVQAFLGYESQRRDRPPANAVTNQAATAGPGTDFSRDRTMSPKEFMRDKHPVTDVERSTCLAYYLAHYRRTPHFKTIDISTLNTEAAQPKFSNASVAVDNAAKLGYLVSATKGNKQISALGERFVELLPDREAARDAVRTYRPRRGRKMRTTKGD